MARKFLTHLDMQGNQIINAVFEKLSDDPSSGNFEGRLYYNTALDVVRVYDGGKFVDAGIPVVATEPTVGNYEGRIVYNTTENMIKSYSGTEWLAAGNVLDIAAGTDIDVSASAGIYTISLESEIGSDTTGNAATASKLATARTIALSGDVSGSVTFDGSANVDITTTIGPNSVTLGTDTTGDYVASVSASTGISVSGTGEGAAVTVTNTDKGSDQNIFKNVTVGANTIVADSNDDTLTFTAGSGIGVTANPTTDTVEISNTGVLSVSGTPDQISASTVNGDVTISLPSAVTFPGTVTLNADPTQALHAATKQYVDSVVEGLHIHASVAVATTASVDLSNPPAEIDGVTLTDGMRVLVKNQGSAADNGIYVYNLATTDLVRASDYNSAAEIQAGDFVFVSGGDTWNSTGWVQENAVTVLGTDPIVWTQFSGAGTYLAGNGLTLTGTTFAIDTAVTVDVSTQQTLSNKTLTSPVVSGLYLSDNNIVVEGTDNTHETTLIFTDPTQDNNITFKDATGTVAFTSDIPTSTDGLSEGSTNLYFTNERAEDAVGAILTDTATVDLTYTDNGASAGTITADVILKASNSYLTSASGLAVDITSVETKLVTDSFTRKATANVGNASATSFAVNHNFGTRDVVVNVYDSATYDTVEVDVVRTNENTVTVSFATAPGVDAYRVVVIG